MSSELAGAPERLRISELMYYQADMSAALKFYSEALGWKVKANYGGSYALLSVGGAFDLAISGAEFAESGWEAGQPVPPGVINAESSDLAASIARLRASGIVVADATGSVESIVTSAFSDPWGNSVMLWQDGNSSGAAEGWPGAPQAEPAPQPDGRYRRVEALLLVEDLAEAEAFYQSSLGLDVFEQSGGAYTALRQGAGPLLGLLLRSAWHSPESAPRGAQITIECPDLNAERTRLAAGGVLCGAVKPEQGMAWFGVNDPSGNSLVFWQNSN